MGRSHAKSIALRGIGSTILAIGLAGFSLVIMSYVSTENRDAEERRSAEQDKLRVEAAIANARAVLDSPASEPVQLERARGEIEAGLAWLQGDANRHVVEAGEGVALVMVVVLWFGASVLGYAVMRRGRRYAIDTAWHFKEGQVPNTILYLRDFDADQLSKSSLRLSVSTVEEQLIKALSEIGPAVALGRPGEKLPPIGAARVYYSDDEWKTRVKGLVNSARLVVIQTGVGEGLRWEVENIIPYVRPQKLIIAVNDAASIRAFQEWMSPVVHWKEELRFRRCFGQTIRGFIIFDNQWVPTCIRLKRFALRRVDARQFREFRIALQPVLQRCAHFLEVRQG